MSELKTVLFPGPPVVQGLSLVAAAAIGGRVVNEYSGKPIAGVTLRVWDSQMRLAATVRTDSAGMYRVEGVPRGSYMVSVDTPAGYLADCDENPVTVAARGVLHASFRLRPSGALSGKVVEDASGDPVEGALVAAVDPQGKQVSVATTTAEGTFAFAGLELKDYKVEIVD